MISTSVHGLQIGVPQMDPNGDAHRGTGHCADTRIIPYRYGWNLEGIYFLEAIYGLVHRW